MQMQMYVCERKWCDFVVYNPNYDNSLIIKRVDRNEETIEKLVKGLTAGRKMIIDIIEKMKNGS